LQGPLIIAAWGPCGQKVSALGGSAATQRCQATQALPPMGPSLSVAYFDMQSAMLAQRPAAPKLQALMYFVQ
jgi:hypothetical protein